MFQWKKLTSTLLVSVLISCSSDPKKEDEKEKKQKEKDNELISLYQLPQIIDLEKAARLNVELGIGYLSQNQVPRAKSKFLRAMKIAPHLPEVHSGYAYFQEQTGDMDNAEKAYLKAISLNPKGGSGHHDYGSFLCRQKQYRKAEKEFLKAVADPHFMQTGESLENAGLCVLQIPDQEKAIEYFERAILHDSDRTQAILELALIHFRAGRTYEAQQYFNKFNKISEANARSLLLGVELAKLEGNKDKISRYESLLRSNFPQAKPADILRVAMGRS